LSREQKQNKRKKTRKSASGGLSKGRILLVILLLLIGLGILLYPTISNLWNEYIHFVSIGHYEETVTELDTAEIDRLMAEARDYNANHTKNVIMDAFDDDNQYVLTHPYDTMLAVDSTGMMCYLEIPKLKEKMVVYHGISAKVLERGVGHIEGTSLPVGGESTHTVMSAHRGLPSAKLFTNLDQIVLGDQFYIHVLNEHLAYEVDEINVVLPEETSLLDIVPGQDLATLVTCTPYGVNTHRLLVRGHRVPYVPPEEPTVTFWEKMSELKFAIITLLAVLLIADIVFIVFRVRRKKKKR
jgi:sortase A